MYRWYTTGYPVRNRMREPINMAFPNTIDDTATVKVRKSLGRSVRTVSRNEKYWRDAPTGHTTFGCICSRPIWFRAGLSLQTVASPFCTASYSFRYLFDDLLAFANKLETYSRVHKILSLTCHVRLKRKLMCQKVQIDSASAKHHCVSCWTSRYGSL